MKLELTAEERDELVQIIEHTLGETRVEVRRTRNPDWHDQLQIEEETLRSLLERLRRLEG